MEGQWDDAGQIVHAEWGRRWSGGTNQALLLVRTLKARGVQGVLVCPVGSAMEERAQGHGVPTVSFPLRGEGDLKAWWQFARWLKGTTSSGTTLLHAHSRRGALPTLLIARWLRLPTVLHWRVAAPMPRLLARLASFVVAVSEVAAEKARQAGIPKERVAVTRSVVESERFVPPPNARRWARERLELPADAFVVAGVGRMVAGKGYEQLVEAVALMVPTERPHLLLTGDGPMRAELERAAAKRRVGDWVRFWGFQADVRPILWAADVLAHVPTHFPEGTPNTILRDGSGFARHRHTCRRHRRNRSARRNGLVGAAKRCVGAGRSVAPLARRPIFTATIGRSGANLRPRAPQRQRLDRTHPAGLRGRLERATFRHLAIAHGGER